MGVCVPHKPDNLFLAEVISATLIVTWEPDLTVEASPDPAINQSREDLCVVHIASMRNRVF